MLTPIETAAIIGAIKATVDVFDKLARPIKRVLLGSKQHFDRAEAKDQRWRFKIGTKGPDVLVTEDGEVRQTVTGAQLARMLNRADLELVKAYEEKMDDYFLQWITLYPKKDASPDGEINEKTLRELKRLVIKMRRELLGILQFLERIGIHLDDHYMHIRVLVEKARRVPPE